jgi:formiminotetrahydrofolate cyclodeaminase
MSQQKLPDPNSPYLSLPTHELLSAFGAGNAAPGSGSAAALMGLLSAKLILTVCSLSKKQKKCEPDSKSFDEITEDIRKDIEPRLSRLFEDDAELFDQVILSRRLRNKSTTKEEESDFARQANERLAHANDCVFEITELCLRLIDHGISIFEKGWGTVRGDSGAAISAAISGVTSGICILSLNLNTLGDSEYSRANMEKYKRLYASLKDKQGAALDAAASIHTETMKALQPPGN